MKLKSTFVTQIIDGKKIRDDILKELKNEIESLPFVPVFCDILVGDNPVSLSYVLIKEKIAESVGVKFTKVFFKESITTEELIQEIENLNRVPFMCGIIIQLPLPYHIDRQRVLNSIIPEMDVDCLGEINTNKFYNDEESLVYPTALSCMKILDFIGLDFKQKNFLVLGQGKLVGLPVTHLLKKRGYKVSIADSHTPDVLELVKKSDVIISAIGQGGFIKGPYIKEGAILIDAGTSEDNGSVVGDVNFDSVLDIASYATPTPGGVGPVTVAMLIKNVLEVAKNKK